MKDLSGIQTADEVLKKHTITTLKKLNNNKTHTAKALGVTLKTLYNWLENWGESKNFRKYQ